MVGHHFDDLRRAKDREKLGPIRAARRMFKIGVDRDEGLYLTFNDEFSLNTMDFFIKNGGFCIKHHGFRI